MREQRDSTPMADGNAPDEWAPAPVKTCCTGRVQRILEEVTAERSVTPEITPTHAKMRQKRAKAYRKLMALYSMSFGFRQPYQVLSKPALSYNLHLN